MLEIAIIVCVAAVFVIIAFRFPKTGNLSLAKREKSFDDEAAILEAKKILNEKSPEDLPEVLPAGVEPTDELDAYDEELSELLKSAREKIDSGKYASAENVLIDAICKDSKCAWAYERLGHVYLMIGKNLNDATESFLMATKIDRDNDSAWFGLGQIYFSEAHFNKAIDAFSKAVNISRTDAQYLAALGKAYLEVRQYGKASKSLKRAASLDISNAEYKKLASFAEDKHREHSRASKLS